MDMQGAHRIHSVGILTNAKHTEFLQPGTNIIGGHVMKKFLVFYKYKSQVQVSRVSFLGEPTSEECIESINRTHTDVISIQPYDVFIVSL